MDKGQFDALARLVSTRQSRRAALATLLGATLLPLKSAPADARRKGKDKDGVTAQADRRCYRGTNCTPGKGKNTSGCDFSGSIDFFEGDFRGSNLSKSNFTNAQMAKGDFRGANLSGACLVGANLLDAKLGASVNLDKAVFCQTLMPDGSENDRDCGQGTACCPAPLSCEGEECEGACIGAPNAQCSLSIPYGGCCPGLHCVPSSTNPIRTTCQAPCGADGSCRARFGAAWRCASEPVICRYLNGECCQHI